MARQTTWKGFIKLSLVSCPVRLHPATTRANRIAFHNLSRATHNRVELRPHDPETGREVDREHLVRGFETGSDTFVIVEDEEFKALEIESSHTIELENFVARAEIDPIYYDTPYFLAPDGPVADETFRVIRDAMARRGKAGLGRVVLAGRERIVAVEPRDKGMLLTTLRTADEVRGTADYFAEIGKGEPDDEAIELARRVIGRKTGHFDPGRFEDRYQTALAKLIEAKIEGEEPVAPRDGGSAPVIDLMAALKRSLADMANAAAPDRPAVRAGRPADRKPARKVEGKPAKDKAKGKRRA